MALKPFVKTSRKFKVMSSRSSQHDEKDCHTFYEYKVVSYCGLNLYSLIQFISIYALNTHNSFSTLITVESECHPHPHPGNVMNWWVFWSCILFSILAWPIFYTFWTLPNILAGKFWQLHFIVGHHDLQVSRSHSHSMLGILARMSNYQSWDTYIYWCKLLHQ